MSARVPRRRSAGRAALVPMVALLACLAAGCAILPIPTRRHVPIDYGTRGRVPARALESLGVGEANRTQVLLALGEPDRAWEDDRYFFYRWTTVGGYWFWILAGGYQGVGGFIGYGERDHDLVLEFDGAGTLRRRASLRTWGGSNEAGGDERERELPVELSPDHVHMSGPEPARLVLDRAELRFTDVRRPRHSLAFSPGQVEAIRLQGFGQVPRAVGRVGCELRFRDDSGRRQKLRMILTPEDMLVLLDFARRACPAARIEG